MDKVLAQSYWTISSVKAMNITLKNVLMQDGVMTIVVTMKMPE